MLVNMKPEESVASRGAQEGEGKAEASHQHVAHPGHHHHHHQHHCQHHVSHPDHHQIYSGR